MRVAWTRRALAQLQHQYEYVAARNPRAAEVLLRDCLKQSRLLEQFPFLGKAIKRGRREKGVQENYVIHYVIAKAAILVMSFWHTSQLRPHGAGEQ
ncbi:hypothetical protein CDN99_02875 [Roseateles aquatilis]|uniref:Plasmid stabilization protein n=1 Tax=Roseateles aquatilis TaxID=431061 RepID=A0A246JLE4_9BURK|nr:type II toxin-antitoxin system RelE/ParE family toxin [Roseateles aquatilis]OWQ93432.1 hypothetical protein CDN99_02875 [Roseateles aquatilis]